MEVVIADCPLGAKCEEVGERAGVQVLLRCPWYIKIEGKDPQSERDIEEWRCAIAWSPILHLESSQQTRGVHHAVDSLRNESSKGQEEFLSLVQGARQKQIGS